MFYYIFETTNKLTGKKYRGLHSSEASKDSYLGSSVQLKKDIKEYGRENFVREELEYFISLEHLLSKERDFIPDEWFKREDTYNIKRGGVSVHGEHKKELSEKVKKRISRGMKRKYKEGLITTKGKVLGPLSDLHKEKISEGMKKVYEDGSYTGCKGKTFKKKPMTIEDKERLAETKRVNVETREGISTVNGFVFKLKF